MSAMISRALVEKYRERQLLRRILEKRKFKNLSVDDVQYLIRVLGDFQNLSRKVDANNM
jgi:hypothetical protein